MIPWPSARMVRAIAVIAAGVVVVAVVSLHYLGVGLPGPASPSPTPSPSSPIVAAPNVVRGPIVVFDSRHDDVAWGLQPDGTDYALSRTVDGGARWQRLATLPTIPIFATRSLGFAIIYGPSGIASGMLRTTDGGATWRPVGALPAPQASQWLQARVTFVDTRHGWLTVPTAGATDVQSTCTARSTAVRTGCGCPR